MRALYSLNCFGCRPGGFPPHLSAFIFRVYCQPIVAYCLEAVHVATQLQANIFTYNILGFLPAQYASIEAPSHSAIHQLGETAKLLNVDIYSTNYRTCSNLLDTHYFTCENELV